MKIPFFSEHIENYTRRTGLRRKTLLLSLGWLWGMLLISMFFIGSGRIILLLSCVGAAVTCHLLWIARGRKRDGGT
ncbi:MAG: hypothetical protein PHZ09_13180 [Eubacteriales bacterium]|jgi:hypothetical protein|nr:hypothetical protein [Eubacteriales bacterium]